MKYFDYCAGLTMTNKHFITFFRPMNLILQEGYGPCTISSDCNRRNCIENGKDCFQEKSERFNSVVGMRRLNCEIKWKTSQSGPFKKKDP